MAFACLSLQPHYEGEYSDYTVFSVAYWGPSCDSEVSSPQWQKGCICNGGGGRHRKVLSSDSTSREC